MERLLSVGYAAIDVIKGEEYRGGAAAGLAINGRRLGMETGLCALFGMDERSLEYWDALVSEGVNMALSEKIDGVQMPQNAISHEDRTAGWNAVGITDYFSRVNIDSSRVKAFQRIHLASAHYALARKLLHSLDDHDARLSYSPGPKTVIDPAHYLDADILQKSDILFLNREEWLTARKHFDLNEPTDLLHLGPKITVITFGHEGSLVSYMQDGKTISSHIPVPSVAGETTGAGDAYALGFIIGQECGCSPQKSGEIGTALALLAIQRLGGLIDRSYLSQFKQTHLNGFFHL